MARIDSSSMLKMRVATVSEQSEDERADSSSAIFLGGENCVVLRE
jgi:hypothetical protein